MSQSVFLALVNVYDDVGEYNKELSVDTVGFSRIATLICLIVGSIAILGGFINGFRKYPAGIPVVGAVVLQSVLHAILHRMTFLLTFNL